MKSAPPFGQRLASARKSRGWSQAEFGRKLGVTRALIDYYERRAKNPTSDFVQRAASVLELDVSDLIGQNGHPQRKRSGPSSKLERQIDEIRKLPRPKQKFISDFLETVIQQEGGAR